MSDDSKKPDARKQWKNICDALAEDALHDETPLTDAQRASAERLKTKILRHAAKVEAEREERKKPKYIN